MTLHKHLQNLQSKHLKLKEKLKNPLITFQQDTEIKNLKKKKLLLKEKIHHLQIQAQNG